eukprot:COSAG02_NODE_9737_length_2126_cov_65.111001_1_plen_200_part_10
MRDKPQIILSTTVSVRVVLMSGRPFYIFVHPLAFYRSWCAFGNEMDVFNCTDMVKYHDKWNNNNTVSRIEASYPRKSYRTEAYRVTRFGTDICFRCDTRRAARALSGAGIDVYLYNFAYRFKTWRDPESDECQEQSEALCGVYHASELRFVFDNFQFPLAEEDKQMAATIGTLWTSFAKHGTPRLSGRSEATETIWPLYN